MRRYGVEAIEAAVCLMEMHPRAKKTRTSNYFGMYNYFFFIILFWLFFFSILKLLLLISDKAVDSKKEKLKHKKVKEGKRFPVSLVFIYLCKML